MAKCRSCGAEIIWVKLASGKSMPCDAESVTYWADDKGDDMVVTPNGEVVRARLSGEASEATGIGYISHFATCPNADRHRKGGKR